MLTPDRPLGGPAWADVTRDALPGGLPHRGPKPPFEGSNDPPSLKHPRYKHHRPRRPKARLGLNGRTGPPVLAAEERVGPVVRGLDRTGKRLGAIRPRNVLNPVSLLRTVRFRNILDPMGLLSPIESRQAAGPRQRIAVQRGRVGRPVGATQRPDRVGELG